MIPVQKFQGIERKNKTKQKQENQPRTFAAKSVKKSLLSHLSLFKCLYEYKTHGRKVWFILNLSHTFIAQFFNDDCYSSNMWQSALHSN